MDFKNVYLSIIGLIGLLFWLIKFFHFGKKAELFYPFVKSENKVDGKKILRTIMLVVGIVGWLLISFSLTGPRKSLKFSKSNIEVNDIFFVVDVSLSMLAIDFKPNRLEAAKRKMLDFVSLRPTDRIGIVMFSEKPFTLLPLTTDLEVVKKVSKDIKTGFLGKGTNIGDAVGLAVARAAQSPTKNKIIILLTDGVSNIGNLTPLQATRMAKEQKIKIYTIAIGSDKDAKIPVGKGLFGGTRYQYIPGGSIDLKLLKEMAQITGGKSYIARDEESLKNILDDIENLEKTEIKVSKQVVYKELFFKFLLTGIFLLLLSELTRKLVLREIL